MGTVLSGILAEQRSILQDLKNLPAKKSDRPMLWVIGEIAQEIFRETRRIYLETANEEVKPNYEIETNANRL